EVKAAIEPLLAVHRAAFSSRSGPASESRDLPKLTAGLREILFAPDAILRAYPEDVRARLLALANEIGLADLAESKDAVRRLLDSLPKSDASATQLRIARADQLLAAGHDRDAQALINEL